MVCTSYLGQTGNPTLQSFIEHFPEFLPLDLTRRFEGPRWVEILTDKYNAVPLELTTTEAQRDFLRLTSKLPLYGSRFFPLDHVTDKRIVGPCILCINKKGLTFLHPKSRAKMLSYSFNEVISTRRLGSRESGKHFVDLKLGNLMVQRVTRCTTRQGAEITTVISSYVSAYVEQEHQKTSVDF